jgi:transcriptional regulator of arginine metabolism
MKSFRQSVVLEIVESEAISSQEQLRDRLKARGIEATQATLSRDIHELGLIKRPADGAYRRPPATAADASGDPALVLRRAVEEYLRREEAVDHLLVLKTDTGQAQPLAVAIDRAQLHEIVGTIAGDDTILVICRTPKDASALASRLNELRTRPAAAGAR